MSDPTSSRDDGTVERTADGGVIRFERHLAFPIREVWDAVAIDNCSVVGFHASLARLVPCLAGQPIAWDWDGFAEAQSHDAAG